MVAEPTQASNLFRLYAVRAKVTRSRFENSCTQMVYARRYLFYVFLPVQLMATWVAVSGIVYNYVNEKEYDFNVQILDAFVGAFMIFITNVGRNLNYEGCASQHEQVALSMKKTLDELDMIEHVARNGENVSAEEFDAKLSRIETDFFKHDDESLHNVLPPSIALPFANLKFRLSLILRPMEFGKAACARGRFSCRQVDDGKWDVDDETFYTVLNYAYGELAVYISLWQGLRIPPPDQSVEKTIAKVVQLLMQSPNEEALPMEFYSPRMCNDVFKTEKFEPKGNDVGGFHSDHDSTTTSQRITDSVLSTTSPSRSSELETRNHRMTWRDHNELGMSTSRTTATALFNTNHLLSSPSGSSTDPDDSEQNAVADV